MFSYMTCHMIQFERFDWLKLANVINIMTESLFKELNADRALTEVEVNAQDTLPISIEEDVYNTNQANPFLI